MFCFAGEDFYGAFDAQELAIQYSEELGVQPVISANIVFTEDGFMTVDEAKEKNAVIKKISGTKFRKMLRAGEDIPTWFAFESVVKLLRNPE